MVPPKHARELIHPQSLGDFGQSFAQHDKDDLVCDFLLPIGQGMLNQGCEMLDTKLLKELFIALF